MLSKRSLKKWKKAVTKYLLDPDPEALYPGVIAYSPSAEATGESIKEKIKKLRMTFCVYHQKIHNIRPLVDDVVITGHEEVDEQVRMDKTGADPPFVTLPSFTPPLHSPNHPSNHTSNQPTTPALFLSTD